MNANYNVVKIANAIKNTGGQAYLVGGCVRDEILGLVCKDIDIECYGLEPEVLYETIKPLGKVDCVGESFKVYKLTINSETFDISIPRIDKKIGEGHKGFLVEGNPYATFEDACRRRDFTLNAILKDPLTGKIEDPFGGIIDIDDKIIRAVDKKHFGEDSLRVLRCMQLSSRFDFDIEFGTVMLCNDIDIKDLPKERIWEEWRKMLLKSHRPSKGILSASLLGITYKLFNNTLQPVMDNFAKNWDMFTHTDFDILSQYTDRFLPEEDKIIILMARICSWIYSYSGIKEVEEFLDQVGVISEGVKIRDSIINLVIYEKEAIDLAYMTVNVSRVGDGISWIAQDYDYRRFSLKTNPVMMAVLLHNSCGAKFLNFMDQYGVMLGPPEKFVMGQDLIDNFDMKPGKEMGILINMLYVLQIDNKIKNKEEALKEAETYLLLPKG